MNETSRPRFSLSSSARKARIKTLLSGVDRVPGALPLSNGDTLNLVEQHLRCKGSSRLPVLIVAAAYRAAKVGLDRRVFKLTARNANGRRTGAPIQIRITVVGDNQAVARCEMQDRAVLRGDIDRAVQEIAKQGRHVQNYIFITTEPVSADIREYARSKYDETGGVEIAILDCIGFLHHFLHLFHGLRKDFLDQYQGLVLREPESAVSQVLKEAFLALRQAAEVPD
ncbi:MAG: hypothetical protein HY646_19065 [Acidobacteria bacterium]|nr:hypothetical protein [Acidobacteriota bacterium]